MENEKFESTNKLFELLESYPDFSDNEIKLENGWKIGDIVRYIDCDEDDEFEGEITSIEDINCFSIDEYDGYYIEECELVTVNDQMIDDVFDTKFFDSKINYNSNYKITGDIVEHLPKSNNKSDVDMIHNVLLNRNKRNLSYINSPIYNKLRK